MVAFDELHTRRGYNSRRRGSGARGGWLGRLSRCPAIPANMRWWRRRKRQPPREAGELTMKNSSSLND